MSKCETCTNLLDKETCYIYGTPNHDISICKDYTRKPTVYVTGWGEWLRIIKE